MTDTLDLTDMLRVTRKPANVFKGRGEAFTLYRWQYSERRRSGVYMPIARALTAEAMHDYLLRLDMRVDELRRFDEFCGSFLGFYNDGAQSRAIPAETSPRNPVPLQTEPRPSNGIERC